MDGDFDIYDDLDEVKDQVNVKEQTEEIQKLKDEINILNEKLTNIGKQNNELLELNNNLKHNVSRILVTAKAEVNRKDNKIAEITKEKDSIIFRRGNNKQNINKNKSSRNIETQTDFSEKSKQTKTKYAQTDYFEISKAKKTVSKLIQTNRTPVTSYGTQTVNIVNEKVSSYSQTISEKKSITTETNRTPVTSCGTQTSNIVNEKVSNYSQTISEQKLVTTETYIETSSCTTQTDAIPTIPIESLLNESIMGFVSDISESPGDSLVDKYEEFEKKQKLECTATSKNETKANHVKNLNKDIFIKEQEISNKTTQEMNSDAVESLLELSRGRQNNSSHFNNKLPDLLDFENEDSDYTDDDLIKLINDKQKLLNELNGTEHREKEKHFKKKQIDIQTTKNLQNNSHKHGIKKVDKYSVKLKVESQTSDSNRNGELKSKESKRFDETVIKKKNKNSNKSSDEKAKNSSERKDVNHKHIFQNHHESQPHISNENKIGNNVSATSENLTTTQKKDKELDDKISSETSNSNRNGELKSKESKPFDKVVIKKKNKNSNKSIDEKAKNSSERKDVNHKNISQNHHETQAHRSNENKIGNYVSAMSENLTTTQMKDKDWDDKISSETSNSITVSETVNTNNDKKLKNNEDTKVKNSKEVSLTPDLSLNDIKSKQNEKHNISTNKIYLDISSKEDSASLDSSTETRTSERIAKRNKIISDEAKLQAKKDKLYNKLENLFEEENPSTVETKDKSSNLGKRKLPIDEEFRSDINDGKKQKIENLDDAKTNGLLNSPSAIQMCNTSYVITTVGDETTVYIKRRKKKTKNKKQVIEP